MREGIRVAARLLPGVLLVALGGRGARAAEPASSWPTPEPGVAEKVRAAVARVDRVASQGPFKPDWDSLKAYQVPAWYLDAKFGIFIHWGVYSVPAFGNEWYPRNMYKKDTPEFAHHVATYGPQKAFGYKDFIPKLTAEEFDARHWAEVFRKAGARFVVPVAEHHDGYAMYDSSLSRWTAAKIGPRRDVIGELAAAVRGEGLHFGLSSHRAEHWWFFDQGRLFDSDVSDPQFADLYGPAQPEKASTPDPAFLDDWLARMSDLVEKYQPELVWFDWWIEQPVFRPYLPRFAAYYYNRAAAGKWGPVINYKHEAFPKEAAVFDVERGKLDQVRAQYWQTDTSICKRSWGYVLNHDYRTVDSLVDDLVDIVSKNGALLLNIAPRPDGVIPDPQEQILLGIGQWLARNGEAVYGTRPWKVYGEGPTKVVAGSFKDTASQPFTAADIRFTAKGSTLYAVALAWPPDGRMTIRSLAEGTPLTRKAIARVELLGSKAEVRWSRTAEGLTVDLPAGEKGEHALALKIAPVDEAPAVPASGP